MVIDLILLNPGDIHWASGSTEITDCSIKEINTAVLKVVNRLPFGYLFFYNPLLGQVSENQVKLLTDRPNQIVFGAETDFPELLSYVVPSSYFNLRPSENIFSYTSWLVSLNCCLIDKQLLQGGFLDDRFQSVQGAVLNWTLQQVYAGAIIRYSKAFGLPRIKTQQVSYKDQIRLVKNHMGFTWAAWTCFRLAASRPIPACLLSFFLLSLIRQKSEAVKQVNWHDWKKTPYHRQAKVTVLIPTVDRYAYLIPMLAQLSKQTVPAFEIIVIDQTKKEARQELHFPNLPLKVLYMEESGQCRSRNLGLQHSRGDYILFLDDDDEVYPELVEDHLKCLSCFNADVSCGTCTEPGSNYAPAQYKMIRIADVFPTNNGMIKREVLYKTGLFDMAYDHGQRADGDLGARVFLSGALMILNPAINVIHHRAPQGGLRKYNVRKVTYGSSRSNITHRRLPHITELYFNKRYFTLVQQREYMVHSVIGTFSIRGSLLKKLAKLFFSLLMLPDTLYTIYSRSRKANTLIKSKPHIPRLTG